MWKEVSVCVPCRVSGLSSPHEQRPLLGISPTEVGGCCTSGNTGVGVVQGRVLTPSGLCGHAKQRHKTKHNTTYSWRHVEKAKVTFIHVWNMCWLSFLGCEVNNLCRVLKLPFTVSPGAQQKDGWLHQLERFHSATCWSDLSDFSLSTNLLIRRCKYVVLGSICWGSWLLCLCFRWLLSLQVQ